MEFKNINNLDQEMDLDMEEYLREDLDGTKILALKYPYKVSKKTGNQPAEEVDVTELSFRRPRAGDLDLLEKITEKRVFGPTRQFVSALCKVSDDTIKNRMDSEDFFRAMEVAMSFLPQPKRKMPESSSESSEGGEPTLES